jgi:putative NADPH-quinone reductase
MEKKKVFVLLGHPVIQSSLGSLADAYIEGAKESGHEVRRVNIADVTFDPILHNAYNDVQPLESDLVMIQENFKWADHIVILYPNWWCTMPALLKGMFDRMYVPGFAFRFKKDRSGKRTGKVEPLLKGKSGRVIVTTGTHPWLIRIIFGDFTNELSRGILWFSGISPVRVTTLGPSDEHTPAHKRETWRKKIYQLGKKAK